MEIRLVQNKNLKDFYELYKQGEKGMQEAGIFCGKNIGEGPSYSGKSCFDAIKEFGPEKVKQLWFNKHDDNIRFTTADGNPGIRSCDTGLAIIQSSDGKYFRLLDNAYQPETAATIASGYKKSKMVFIIDHIN